jgi:hypothetical protein
LANVEVKVMSAIRFGAKLHLRRAAGILALACPVAGCTPGYMKPSDLEAKEQGPGHCAKRCHELGMDMGALVLVSDQLPGCVCVPRAGTGKTAELGAGASTTGYAVVLAAAAAAQQQRQQQQRQQQQRQQQLHR